MRYVKSCGFVAYKQIENENYYLIIKGRNGDVGFPKGRMEDGESELQTAIRELKEETGVEVEPIDGFRSLTEYKLKRASGAIKQVVYFLGKCTDDNVVIQPSEILSAEFLSYADALKALTFEETKNILSVAESFIK